MWGSGRSALHNFQTGHWGWGLLDTAFLVLDVVAVVAGVVSLGAATAAWMGAETGLKAAARAAMRTLAEGAVAKAASAKALATAVGEGVGKMYERAAGALGGAAKREAAAKATEDAKVLAKDAAEAEIARIEQTICAPHAMQHIFEGGIKPVTHGHVNTLSGPIHPPGHYGTGVHSMEAIHQGKARIIPRSISQTAPNGAFKAQVELLDQTGNVVPKKGAGVSTFFPPNWSKEKTMQEIEHAHNSRVFQNGNKWKGVASDGSETQMFLDANGKIISAFPTF
ncbi:hypothetical protein GCM10022409_26460 [Hymenobacter glaciei]|uniref:Bacterial EndoU nuclease domain-containing protein n=1 Tax=Hymenobacter glaciei TaxID=877209 RepID=A0ABP7UBB6_9BACT